jgi:hypothetical protein
MASLGGNLADALSAMRDARSHLAACEAAQQDAARLEEEHHTRTQEAHEIAGQATQAESRARRLEFAATRREALAAEQLTEEWRSRYHTTLSRLEDARERAERLAAAARDVKETSRRLTRDAQAALAAGNNELATRLLLEAERVQEQAAQAEALAAAAAQQVASLMGEAETAAAEATRAEAHANELAETRQRLEVASLASKTDRLRQEAAAAIAEAGVAEAEYAAHAALMDEYMSKLEEAKRRAGELERCVLLRGICAGFMHSASLCRRRLAPRPPHAFITIR